MSTTHIYESRKPLMYRRLHLVAPSSIQTNFLNNAGDFLMACSLYPPFLHSLFKKQKNISYKLYSAREFFSKIGYPSVYQEYPQFIIMLAYNT